MNKLIKRGVDGIYRSFFFLVYEFYTGGVVWHCCCGLRENCRGWDTKNLLNYIAKGDYAEAESSSSSAALITSRK